MINLIGNKMVIVVKLYQIVIKALFSMHMMIQDLTIKDKCSQDY